MPKLVTMSHGVALKDGRLEMVWKCELVTETPNSFDKCA
jgi:hypothetical protein